MSSQDSSQPLRPPPPFLPSPLPNPNPEDKPPISATEQPDSTPPPNFNPFFTLLTTTASPITHHPTVHYIFSDDTPDNDPITAAALQALDPTSASSSPTADGTDGGGGATQERYILVDMDATGTNVLSAQSMSPEWAVTSTEVGAAPTWDDRDIKGEGGGGLMLRIEGMEVLGDRERMGRKEDGDESLEELVEVWERRMKELRRVIEKGEGMNRFPPHEKMAENEKGS